MAAKTALRIPLNGMFLAGILGLCALLGGYPPADATQGVSLLQENEQNSNKQSPPAASAPSAQQPPSSSGQQPAPEASTKSSPAKKSKKKSPKDQPASTASTADKSNDKSKKKVVRHGGTDEPITQISPSMTEAQAAKMRSNTATLLNETDSNLQKLSGKTLPADQQETADQVRQFVEQSKEADQNGDLQRAASLANKAKLLSDALVKP